ncbi:MAG: SAM-dependent methyltransferase, partial [Betaproteobacteria bacterium]|nr:SAM-dependent methyltransferase [Betaproteobacteria bacterium]
SYFLVSVKRVQGVRLMGAHWRKASARASRAVPATQREQNLVRTPLKKDSGLSGRAQTSTFEGL